MTQVQTIILCEIPIFWSFWTSLENFVGQCLSSDPFLYKRYSWPQQLAAGLPLTATVLAGSRLPKSCIMLITAEMSTIAQKWLKGLPLKFRDESFGVIKISQIFFSGNFTGNVPKNDRKPHFLDHESHF